MHSVLVSLTILSLLLCPHHCAAEIASARSSADAREACCDSCHQDLDESLPPGQSPEQPAEENDQRCCLCAGAVLAIGVRSSHSEASELALDSWLGSESDRVQLFASLQLADRAVFPPPIVAGGQTRIAICSLLL